MRRSPFVVLATTLALLAAMLLSVGTASAGRQTRVVASGTITVVSNTEVSTRQAGGATIVTAAAIVDFAGTLRGRATEPYIAVTRANGRVEQRGTGFFTGTVAGRTGTLFFDFQGDATGGVILLRRGTGGLRRARGFLRYETSSTAGVFDYTGRIRFTGRRSGRG